MSKNEPRSFGEIPTKAFFLVVSPGSRYVNQHLVCINDEDLPKLVRRNDGLSSLFLVTRVIPHVGSGTEVRVREIEFIDDSTEVQPALPVEPSRNWVQVMLESELFSQPIRLARIDENGALRGPKRWSRGGQRVAERKKRWQESQFQCKGRGE